eukprot:TRINITY_DN17621_c0_g1_i3.p1 TRINITY_DN17621_c0_g1~~TRINITY_DN17621_c0_g1_i3.p1  ORF type:complete len:379 (-),score=91.88 TRINITY_DN17621_c0_g1_i3:209-1225(-)
MLRSLVGSEMCIRDSLAMLSLVKGVDSKTTVLEVLVRMLMAAQKEVSASSFAAYMSDKRLKDDEDSTTPPPSNITSPSSTSEGGSGGLALEPKALKDKFPKALQLVEFPDEVIPVVTAALQCPLQALAQQLAQLNHSLQRMRKVVSETKSKANTNSSPKDAVTGEPLPDVLMVQLEECATAYTQQVSQLTLVHQSLKGDVAMMLEYFGEKHSLSDSSEGGGGEEVALLTHILQFAKDFKECYERVLKADEELRQKIIRKERRQLKEAAAAAGSGATSVAASSAVSRTASTTGGCTVAASASPTPPPAATPTQQPPSDMLVVADIVDEKKTRENFSDLL